MRSRMCEWYDVRVCGILGSGKRDVPGIEILGRNLRWKGRNTKLLTPPGTAGKVGVERRIKDGQQRCSQTSGNRARRGREHLDETERVQELNKLGRVNMSPKRATIGGPFDKEKIVALDG